MAKLPRKSLDHQRYENSCSTPLSGPIHLCLTDYSEPTESHVLLCGRLPSTVLGKTWVPPILLCPTNRCVRQQSVSLQFLRLDCSLKCQQINATLLTARCRSSSIRRGFVIDGRGAGFLSVAPSIRFGQTLTGLLVSVYCWPYCWQLQPHHYVDGPGANMK